MNAFILLILILVFGFLLAKVLIKSIAFFEAISLGFLLAIGTSTFIMFLYSWIGFRITISSVLIMLFVLIALLYLILVKLTINIINIKLFAISNQTLFNKILLLLIIFSLMLSFIISLYFPITVWDALALYDFRAKIISELGFFVQIAGNYNYFAHYPLLTSLTHTLFYLVGLNNPQFVYSLFLLCFAYIFYINLLKITNRSISLIATLLLITTPEIFEHSTIAYTNLPYTIFYVSGLIYLYNSYLFDRYDYLTAASLLIGLSTWTRSDLPFWLTGILFVALISVLKKSIKPTLIYIVPFLFIQQSWSIFNSRMFGTGYSTTGQVTNAGAALLKGIDVNKLSEIFFYIYNNVIIEWGPLAILFVVFIVINILNKQSVKSFFFLGFIAANLCLLFIGTYLFSLNVVEWKEIADSAVRMSMFFPPLMIYYVSISARKINNKLIK